MYITRYKLVKDTFKFTTHILITDVVGNSSYKSLHIFPLDDWHGEIII